MVILRFELLSRAPSDGVYALVGHYGEPTGVQCDCQLGEPLPPAPTAALSSGMPVWYVRLERGAEARLAA